MDAGAATVLSLANRRLYRRCGLEDVPGGLGFGFRVNPPPSHRYHKDCCRYIKALLTPYLGAIAVGEFDLSKVLFHLTSVKT